MRPLTKRKRPETTVYLGDEVYAKLQAYRKQFPHPPSMSAVIREAVERYITESESDHEMLSLASWIHTTEAHVMLLREQGVNVSTESILSARRSQEASRIEDLIVGGDE